MAAAVTICFACQSSCRYIASSFSSSSVSLMEGASLAICSWFSPVRSSEGVIPSSLQIGMIDEDGIVSVFVLNYIVTADLDTPATSLKVF